MIFQVSFIDVGNSNIQYFLYDFSFAGLFNKSRWHTIWYRLVDVMGNLEAWLFIIGPIVAFILVLIIAYLIVRTRRIQNAENEKFGGLRLAEEEGTANARWQHVLDLSASENPGDWRVAILEADIMLDELVSGMGYSGDTLGEKMKGIEPSDFVTLNAAWEAHKIRNRIAHSGSDFILTGRETQRVISLYKDVFEEFDLV